MMYKTIRIVIISALVGNFLKISSYSLSLEGDKLWWFKKNIVHSLDLNDNNWKTYTLRGTIYDSDISPSGTKWFATKSGVVSLHDSTWTYYTPKSTQQQIFHDDHITGLAYDSSGILWIGTKNGGLITYDGSDWNNIDTIAGTYVPSIKSLRVDFNGDLWVGSDQGVSMFKDSTWYHYTKSNGLLGNAVQNLFLNKSGIMWAETYDYKGSSLDDIRGGLCVFRDGAWKRYQFKNELDVVYTDSHGKMWAVTRKTDQAGSYLYTYLRNIWNLQDSTTSTINALVDYQGKELWLGTDNGLFRYRHKTLEKINPLDNKKITKLFKDHRGSIWYVAKSKRTTYVGSFNGELFKKIELLQDKEVRDIKTIGDDIWVVTTTGIYVYDGSLWKKINSNDPTLSIFITAVSYNQSAQTVWIGTEKGLASFKNQAWIIYRNYGLLRDYVYSVTCDNNNVWINSYHWALYNKDAWTTFNEQFCFTASGMPLQYVDIDRAHTKWFYSPDVAVVKGYRDGTLEEFSDIRSVVEKHYDDFYSAKSKKKNWVSKNNALWIVDRYNEELLEYDKTTWRSHPYNPLSIVKSSSDIIYLSDRYNVYASTSSLYHTLQIPEHIQVDDILLQGDDKLWIQGARELLDYTNDYFVIHPFPGKDGRHALPYQWIPLAETVSVSSIICDKFDNPWIATTKGLYTFAGNKLRKINNVKHPSDLNIKKVFIDPKGAVWIIHNFGASVYEANKWRNYTIFDGLISNIITDITHDTKKTFWLSSLFGISAFNGKKWKSFTKFGTVDYPYIFCSAVDVTNEVWLGTAKGILHYTNKNWINYTTSNGMLKGLPSDTIYSIAIDASATKWFATPRGVFSHNNKQTSYFPELPCTQGSQLSIDFAGTLWCMQYSKEHAPRLWRYNKNSWEEYAQELSKTTLAFDRNNNLYLGSPGGMFILKPTVH